MLFRSASLSINGRAAGVQLADLAQATGDGIFTITLNPPLTNLNNAHLYVQIADQQGNINQVDRKFSIAGSGTTPTPIAGGQEVFLPLTRR